MTRRCGQACAFIAGLLCSGFINPLHAQDPHPKTSYISPMERGLRPSNHSPTLPSPIISIHGLASFPVGTDDNLGSTIQPGPGFRISAAWQPSKQIAAELSYRASTHEAIVDSVSERGFFQSLHLGALLFPLENEQTFRPYVSVGTHALGFFSDRLTNHKMLGFGVDLSGGVGVFLSRHTSISLGLRYLGTFVYSASESYFGERAESALFTNQLSPEIGLVFYP